MQRYTSKSALKSDGDVMTQAVLILLSVVTLGNLALSAALLRKVRSMSITASPGNLPPKGTELSAPAELPWLQAIINRDDSVVVFSSPGCPACSAVRDAMHTNLAELPDTVLVILMGDSTLPAYEIDPWRALGTVVTDMPGGPLHKAFTEPNAFPSIIRSRNGVVVASGHQLSDVLRPAKATSR